MLALKQTANGPIIELRCEMCRCPITTGALLVGELPTAAHGLERR
jgi:hypothetical protein